MAERDTSANSDSLSNVLQFRLYMKYIRLLKYIYHERPQIVD